MKIVTLVRTRDEQCNIQRFCHCYQWVDKILIADGGSEDNTIQLAKAFPNVEVRDYAKKVYGKNMLWRNPHGEHINFLITWAREENADWIIFDDCDCVPTRLLQTNGRLILESCEQSVIFAYRLYIYGEEEYFPKMNAPGQSLWAWKSSLNILADTRNPWEHSILNIPETGMKLDRPNALLHYFAPTEGVIEDKLEFYRLSGESPNIKHPSEEGGDLCELPLWATWR